MELGEKTPFEDAGGAKRSQTEVQLNPRGAKRRAKGAKREPKGTPAGFIFAYILVIFAGFVLGMFFLMVLDMCWGVFCSILGGHSFRTL